MRSPRSPETVTLTEAEIGGGELSGGVKWAGYMH